MAKAIIDGISIEAQKGWTILEAAKFLGLEIPTLCYDEGLSAWGGCRLCIVEMKQGGNTKLVTSCTYPVEDGIEVKTSSKRVLKARKMILELLIAKCPTSKKLQDLAAKMGLTKVRFSPKWDNCIYCGLCVRMCEEQMMANAIGFANRGHNIKITTPFDINSEECRRCGGCIYICPACTLRCEGATPDTVLCGRCENTLQPTCIDINDNFNCWMGLTGSCGTCASLESIKK
ncbi:MAG: (2Fe-2S)-binding protein [Bacteroidia bacterium]|nr:(2Fe-2S)-binding protein [Bacteroidia bacterium]